MNTIKVVVISGNPTQPSRTRVLVQQILDKLNEFIDFEQQAIELAEVGPTLGQCLLRTQLSSEGESVIAAVENAELLIAATPVYRGSYTGPFKHLFDLVGANTLVGVPVILAAIGGSERHALVIDHQLRPLFSFFRAYTAPTGIYATESDFNGYRLTNELIHERILDAVTETVALLGPTRRRTPIRKVAAMGSGYDKGPVSRESLGEVTLQLATNR